MSSLKMHLAKGKDGSISCRLGDLARIRLEPAGGGVPQRDLELLAMFAVQGAAKDAGGLALERTRITREEIPVLLCYPEGAVKLPLVVFQHGYTSHKEMDLQHGISLAKEGFFVVLPDARLHGERRTGEGDRGFTENFAENFLAVIRDTARDVTALIDYFAADPRVDAGRTGMAGISMGGFITFLAASMDKRIKAATPLIGSPDWELILNAPGSSPGPEIRRFAEEWEPLRHFRRLFPAALLIQTGAEDWLVPNEGAKKIYERLRPLYESSPERLEFVDYPGVQHMVTPEMIERAVGWFKRFL